MHRIRNLLVFGKFISSESINDVHTITDVVQVFPNSYVTRFIRIKYIKLYFQ